MAEAEDHKYRFITRSARMALSTIAACGVAPSPENFAVFYVYAEKRHPELNMLIDRLMAEQRPFTQEVCASLQQKVLSPDRDLRAVREANECLSRTLKATQRDIGEARQITADFGTVLAEHADLDPRHQREPVGPSGDMGQIMEQLARVQARLKQSEDEVTALKTRLAEVERSVDIDALTGLANRRYLDENLEKIAGACRENGRGIGVLMADIDFFKTFNDKHGHAVGDHVLRLVARVIRDSVRPGDIVARYGGEEFTILLPGASVEDSRLVAKRIIDQLRGRSFLERHSGRPLGAVTLSIGLAVLTGDETGDAVLRRADRALYRAKSNGRDQIWGG